MKRKWGFTPLSFLLFENTNKTLTFVCYNTLKLCEEVGAMFKILVVEDDKELNRTVCAYLGQNGYETLGCLSANEAYDAMYGGTVFDMIINFRYYDAAD